MANSNTVNYDITSNTISATDSFTVAGNTTTKFEEQVQRQVRFGLPFTTLITVMSIAFISQLTVPDNYQTGNMDLDSLPRRAEIHLSNRLVHFLLHWLWVHFYYDAVCMVQDHVTLNQTSPRTQKAIMAAMQDQLTTFVPADGDSEVIDYQSPQFMVCDLYLCPEFVLSPIHYLISHRIYCRSTIIIHWFFHCVILHIPMPHILSHWSFRIPAMSSRTDPTHSTVHWYLVFYPLTGTIHSSTVWTANHKFISLFLDQYIDRYFISTSCVMPLSTNSRHIPIQSTSTLLTFSSSIRWWNAISSTKMGSNVLDESCSSTTNAQCSSSRSMALITWRRPSHSVHAVQ